MGVRSLLLGAGVVALVGTGVASAAEPMTGEVVDLGCQLTSTKGAGPCGAEGVKRGLPMALRTDDGQLYLLLENHDNPKPYAQLKEKAGQKVSLEGDKVTQGGTQGLIVESLK